MSEEKERMSGQGKEVRILDGCLKAMVSIVFMFIALMIGVQVVIYFVNTHQ